MLTSEGLEKARSVLKACEAGVLTSRPQGDVLTSCLAKPGGVLHEA